MYTNEAKVFYLFSIANIEYFLHRRKKQEEIKDIYKEESDTSKLKDINIEGVAIDEDDPTKGTKNPKHYTTYQRCTIE